MARARRGGTGKNNLPGSIRAPSGEIISFEEHIRRVESYLEHGQPEHPLLKSLKQRVEASSLESLRYEEQICYCVLLFLEHINQSPFGPGFVDIDPQVTRVTEEGIRLLAGEDLAKTFRHWVEFALILDMLEGQLLDIADSLSHEFYEQLSDAVEKFSADVTG